MSRWLEYEIKTAREELALTVQEPELKTGVSADESAVGFQPA
jgi:hypothetical protein